MKIGMLKRKVYWDKNNTMKTLTFHEYLKKNVNEFFVIYNLLQSLN